MTTIADIDLNEFAKDLADSNFIQTVSWLREHYPGLTPKQVLKLSTDLRELMWTLGIWELA